ncbi:MAG: hypothetical protein AAB467_01800 [Patescibacteria group bacterium]
MSHNTRKAKKLNEKGGANPMPSLVFHEGKIDEDADVVQPTPPPASGPPKRGVQPTNNSGYNPTARRLMWFAVITLTLLILGMWAWSLTNQFSDIKWAASPEKVIMDNLRSSWAQSFQTDEGQPQTSEQLKNEIKENLSKLFAGAASSSTSTAQ